MQPCKSATRTDENQPLSQHNVAQYHCDGHCRLSQETLRIARGVNTTKKCAHARQRVEHTHHKEFLLWERVHLGGYRVGECPRVPDDKPENRDVYCRGELRQEVCHSRSTQKCGDVEGGVGVKERQCVSATNGHGSRERMTHTWVVLHVVRHLLVENAVSNGRNEK